LKISFERAGESIHPKKDDFLSAINKLQPDFSH
jgi:hypothetical protein